MGNGALKRAVFLDRDGVVNDAVVRDGLPYPPEPDKLKIPPDVHAALADLRAAGYMLLVVTNQPDVARGTRTQAEIESIHTQLAATLPIDAFYVCYHDDPDGCDCRKPLPGLLMQGARDHKIDLPASYMIGDRWRDIAAGQAAGVRTVFIDHHYRERPPAPPADASAESLGGATRWILNR